MRLNFFNFKFIDDEVLLTNDFGEYIFVDQKDFKSIVDCKLDRESELAKNLVEKRFCYYDTNLNLVQKNKIALREVKGHVTLATSLHIFVVTTACNMKCVYCQANNGHDCSNLYMTKEVAEKAVRIALDSPTKNLSFEFQGGEPLLNFEVIKYIVECAEKYKENHEISYNLVSNLTLLNDEHIEFFKNHNFGISTSIDGFSIVHNSNRAFVDGTGTFDKVCDSIDRLRNAGIHVGAIETTTKTSLQYPEEIVHAYEDLGFESIFIRPLTPLGRALVNWDTIGYTPEEFVDFYKRVFDELIAVNLKGRFLKEDHACIFLDKIHGYMVNYMELRSPCGAGIGQLAYYADGKIYTCDEGRMVSEMGDKSFCLGDVTYSRYSELMKNGVCKTVCASSVLESIPSCCDCVYQPYCGVCPVVNYATYGDVIEKQPRGYKCRINKGILDHIFKVIKENDDDVLRILESWSN